MMRSTVLVVAMLRLVVSCCAQAPVPAPEEPTLSIAISRCVPCMDETVRLSAHYSDWRPAAGADSVLFSVALQGRWRAIGKTRLATDPTKPLEPSVEWRPSESGLFRVQAEVAGSGLVAVMVVPVVTQPVYFCWYGPTSPEARWMTHHLTASESEISALHARGVVALKHVSGVTYVGGPRPEDVKPDVDFATLGPRIIKDYTDTEPWDGIAIDELGMWDQHPDHTRLALGFWEVLKQVRTTKPGQFIAAWQFGALTPLVCNALRDTADLIMCEVYQNYFRAWYDQHTFYEFIKQRVDMARAMGVSKQMIIGLSITTVYGGVTPDELEDQIRAIRTLAPELRGLAFFTTGKCEPEVVKRASDCCYRYWVKPAVGLFSDADLTLSDYQPEHGGTVRVMATVHNVGGMTARNVKVRFWDGDPARGGVQIGAAQIIPRLPAARWVDPQALDAQSQEPPDVMRREGFGMVTVSVTWQARRGPHEIWAEVVPDEQYTVIRGFQNKRISVR